MKFTSSGVSTLGYSVYFYGEEIERNFSYSRDGLNWTDKWNGEEIQISDGESVYVKGDNPDGVSFSYLNYAKFNITGSLACEGNIMSLIGDFAKDIPCDSCFRRLFDNCSGLTSAPELPAMKITESCYDSMFSGCKSLIEMPELPAMELANECYMNMFDRCEKLTIVKDLPATKLAEMCYSNMFSLCTSLVTAPRILATEMAPLCCDYMFGGCSSLEIGVDLSHVTKMEESCFSYMYAECESLVNAPNLTNLDLVTSCYNRMFYECTSLNSITMLSTDISARDCLNSWVNGVSQAGTFTKKSGVEIQSGINGIPEGWEIKEV